MMNFVVGGGEGDAHAEPDRRAHTSQNHVLASNSTCTHTPTLIFILPAPITQIRLRECQNWSGRRGGLLATLVRFAVTVLNPNPTILPEYLPPPPKMTNAVARWPGFDGWGFGPSSVLVHTRYINL